jgi:hypothetical protein
MDIWLLYEMWTNPRAGRTMFYRNAHTWLFRKNVTQRQNVTVGQMLQFSGKMEVLLHRGKMSHNFGQNYKGQMSKP